MVYFGQVEDIIACITGKIDEQMIPNKQEETRNGDRSSSDAKGIKWRRVIKNNNEEEEYGNEEE